MSQLQFWVIDVPGWGRLYGVGTEAEAESWRKEKGREEMTTARKRHAKEEEIATLQFKSIRNVSV